MLVSERVNLEEMQCALQATVIGYRVAVRKVRHTHYYTLVPHHLLQTHQRGSRCAMSGHMLMSCQVYYAEHMFPVQLHWFVHQICAFPWGQIDCIHDVNIRLSPCSLL